jgi:hypothetical protein
MLNQAYDVNNMIVFALVGVCIKLFFSGSPSSDGSTGPASATVWGYGLVVLAIFGILVINFALASQMQMQSRVLAGKWDFFKGLMSESFPSLFTLIILVWLIVMNINYYTRINKGQVSTEFYRFSNAATLLLILQLFVLFKYLNNRFKLSASKLNGNKTMEDSAQDLNDRFAFVIYFTTLLIGIVTAIMNITLEFFSTDG